MITRKTGHVLWMIGLMGGATLLAYLLSPPKLPHARIWKGSLDRLQGAQWAAEIIRQANAIYRELKRDWQLSRHPALAYHEIHQILPAAALYRALQKAGLDRENALSLMRELLWEEIGRLYRPALILLNVWRDPFPLWREMVRLALRTIFPRAGWFTQGTIDQWDCFGFNIIGCVYLNSLTALGVRELTTAFCHMDERMATLVPSSIRWERSGTLAIGSPCCDFRWCRHKSAES